MSYTPTKDELKQMKQTATEALKKWLKPGDTVYTVLKQVSRSGMSRHISAYIVLDGKIVDISWHVAHFMDWKRSDDGGIKIGGCGMDMGFHLVYSLSSVLFRTEQRNQDAGYSLNQQWI